MLVCICKGISDRKLHEEIRKGHRTLAQIRSGCQAGTDCGACVQQIRQILGARVSAARHDSAAE
ncbi:MAG: (2Fe-2S)-binding protein [Nannocystaceae bacterium]